MQLSREREAELIEQNMPKIYRAVDNFMARYTGKSARQASYDDCVQEVAIAFLKYIRNCDTEEKINKFPWYDATNAMSRLVLQNQSVSVPLRTSSFTKITNSIPATVSYDVLVSSGIEIDGMSKHWVPDKETEIDFNLFMSTQNESTQRIASMRMYGMNIREIAGQFGVCFQAIDKKLKKLKEEYDEFDKGDEDDE